MHVAGRRIDRMILLGPAVAGWTADGFCLFFAARAMDISVGVPTALSAVLAFRLLATLLPAAAGTLALVGLGIGPKQRGDSAHSALT